MKYRIFLSLLFLSLFWILPAIAQADIIPLSGSAWSNMDNPATPLIDESTIGWINFNNEHCAVNPAECTCLSKGGVACPNSTYACNDGCAVGLGTYKVTVDSDSGMFSGYAWSENIGWIWFAPTDIPPGEAAANPAKLNLSTPYEVSGWARACAGAAIAGQPNLCTGTGDGSDADTDDDDGWDGWIKLRGTATNGSPYGVSLDTSPVPPAPAEFRGYAWGNDVVGWISFNSKNCDPNGDGNPNDGPAGCVEAGRNYTLNPIPNYKVTTSLPSITTPTVSNPAHSFAAACSQSRIPTFSWDTNAQKPYDYEIQIDEDSNFGSVDVNDTALGTRSTSWSPACSKCCDVFSYNTIAFGANTYYWRVRARNTGGEWSAWAGSSFNTKAHCYPSPDFLCNGANCSTIRPTGEEVVTLTDNSTAYGGATITNCSWSLPVSSTVVETYPPSFCQLDVKFSTGSNQNITLTATDSSGYSCPITKSINVVLPLPEWKEIPPFSWANKFLAMVTNLFKNL